MSDTGEDKMTRGLWVGIGVVAAVIGLCGLIAFLGLKAIGVL